MKSRNPSRRIAMGAASALGIALLASTLALADEQREPERGALVLTSTNDPGGNRVAVFQLETRGTPTLALAQTLATGGKGGASNNAGILQVQGDLGAVANYGSNSVSQLIRVGDFIYVRRQIPLASGCLKPDSVALSDGELFVVGTTCVESHAWPSGALDGARVHLADPSAAQVSVGTSWGAVTMTSGSLLQLGRTRGGALSGAAAPIALPSNANNTPLGEAFWGDVLGFTPAHSPDSFAIVDAQHNVHPVAGPTPAFPTNAPCWVAKGPGNVWYTANSPGKAISIFFSDDKGGVFYKSVPLPGSPTDITVSRNRKWLAVIYAANGNGYVSVFGIDHHGDLSPEATSDPIGVAAFSGVAVSQ
jgi:hypothetical protein